MADDYWRKFYKAPDISPDDTLADIINKVIAAHVAVVDSYAIPAARKGLETLVALHLPAIGDEVVDLQAKANQERMRATFKSHFHNTDQVVSTPVPAPDGTPYRTSPADKCDHGVCFDESAAKGLDAHEVRRRWPRLFGDCPLGCGYRGIYYASMAHYVYGDW